MHDPCTVAFEIRYPWRKFGRKGRTEFEKKYRDSFITIWHVDPENKRGMIVRRSDDTCGWSSVPYSPEDAEKVETLAKWQYREIFGRQYYAAKRESFAYLSFEPSAYDAIYWSWRALKYADRKGWQYGNKIPALTAKELEQIYVLSACPVDNLRHLLTGVKDEETFKAFFFCVFNAYRRHKRPWYKHPRWHFWHWSIQLHPWQNLKRRFWLKCSRCGKRGFKDTPIGNWSGTETWHSGCDNVHPIPQQKDAA